MLCCLGFERGLFHCVAGYPEAVDHRESGYGVWCRFVRFVQVELKEDQRNIACFEGSTLLRQTQYMMRESSLKGASLVADIGGESKSLLTTGQNVGVGGEVD